MLPSGSSMRCQTLHSVNVACNCRVGSVIKIYITAWSAGYNNTTIYTKNNLNLDVLKQRKTKVIAKGQR